MAFWNRKAEVRAATVTQSSPNFMEVFGLPTSASGIAVTTDAALGVPAIWAAVNFISGTLAGLPLDLFQRGKDGARSRVTEGTLAAILHDAPNEELSSFQWRKGFFDNVLTGGRGFTWIERDRGGRVVNLWPLNPAWVTIKAGTKGKTYDYKAPDAAKVTYRASEIIDLPFMSKADGVGHYGPIATNRDVIALAIAATQFGSKFFQNGGVPPFAVTGKFQTGNAMGRAADDLAEATRKAAKEQRQALVLPEGLDIKSIGADAEKSQLVELKAFCVTEIARIYSLPPTFLQDLSNGTFSNTEQQDLHVSKHTLKRWVEAFEQELNLKLFGRGNRDIFVEFNLDGLLRGDFATRMGGYAQAIQNAILTPNEARRIENRQDMKGGDELLIQGATVPLGTQPNAAKSARSDADERIETAVMRYLTE